MKSTLLFGSMKLKGVWCSLSTGFDLSGPLGVMKVFSRFFGTSRSKYIDPALDHIIMLGPSDTSVDWFLR